MNIIKILILFLVLFVFLFNCTSPDIINEYSYYDYIETEIGDDTEEDDDIEEDDLYNIDLSLQFDNFSYNSTVRRVLFENVIIENLGDNNVDNPIIDYYLTKDELIGNEDDIKLFSLTISGTISRDTSIDIPQEYSSFYVDPKIGGSYKGYIDLKIDNKYTDTSSDNNTFLCDANAYIKYYWVNGKGFQGYGGNSPLIEENHLFVTSYTTGSTIDPEFTSKLFIYDITDKPNPILVSSYDASPVGKLQDMFIKDDYVYITAGEEGLIILDISDINNPKHVKTYDTTGDADSFYKIHVENNYAYIIGSDRTGPNDDFDGIIILDITDVNNPIYKSSFSTYPMRLNDIAYKNNHVVVGSWGSNNFRIIDVNNPEHPYLKGSCDTNGTDILSIHIVDNYAYLANYHGVSIVNISDFNNPFREFYFNEDLSTVKGIFVNGNRAYITSGSTSGLGLVVLNIENLNNIYREGFVLAINFGIGFLTVDSNHAYVGASGGFMVFDISEQ